MPAVKLMPAIIAFLGYNPLPLAGTIAEQLVRPTTLCLLQKEAARQTQIGVDQGTLSIRGRRPRTRRAG